MAKSTKTTNKTQLRSPSARRFVGVRQRPSGRWVAEIKDSSQRVRLWLGTYDTAEEAAWAYDEAARALRGNNARTNFAMSENDSNSNRFSDNFSGLKAKLSNMARANNNNINNNIINNNDKFKSRVSDHFTFASIFHFNRYNNSYNFNNQFPNPTSLMVQPSIVVPSSQTETTSYSQAETGFVKQVMGYVDSYEMVRLYSKTESTNSEMLSDGTTSNSGSNNKRLKVCSSVIVPPTFCNTLYQY